MKLLPFFPALLAALTAHAEVISPSSVEVKFAFESEFQTSQAGTTHDLVLDQAKFLFGYLQNPEIGAQFGLDREISGIGAPRWEPAFTVLAERSSGRVRSIRYSMNGLLLLNQRAAERLLAHGGWNISLPYDLDHFFDKACADPHYQSPDEFWYFNFPFKAGCEHLRQAPLAHPVALHLSPANAVEDQKVGLETLRGGQNGNGDIFQISTINGFAESARNSSDEGRVNFMAMNAWLLDRGFRQTILAHFNNRPVYLFEKDIPRANGSTLHARILRLLADTDLDDSKKVTFVKFLKKALEESDVVIYEGHSGMGVNLDLKTVEQQLLLSKDSSANEPVKFNRTKHQIFFFDSCSSYSYYLGMFSGKKDPGTLAVMSNGLESLFSYELPTSQRLFSMLLDLDHPRLTNDALSWKELLTALERSLDGNTFMLNVDINN